jgi:peptide/nickel transport system substrate-binding protein
MAVDVKSIVDNILEGSAVMPKSYLAPTVFGFKDMELQKRYPYDPKKAKALLAEAGWKDTDGDGFLDKDGKKLALRFLGAKGRYLMDAECCEAIQAQLKEIGVDAQLDFLEWAATFSILRKPELDYNIYTVGWVTTNADADYSLYAMFHSGQMLPKGWNFNRFRNSAVDKLLDEARSTLEREKRKTNYDKVQDILAEQAPWIPIYNTKETFVLNKKVKGFVPDALEYQLTLSGVWLEQ